MMAMLMITVMMIEAVYEIKFPVFGPQGMIVGVNAVLGFRML